MIMPRGKKYVCCGNGIGCMSYAGVFCSEECSEDFIGNTLGHPCCELCGGTGELSLGWDFTYGAPPLCSCVKANVPIIFED